MAALISLPLFNLFFILVIKVFSMKYIKIFLCLLSVFLFFSCSKKRPLFELIAPEHSNIHFNNLIVENDSINPIDVTNIYNGGGVGMGDFNNDGYSDIALILVSSGSDVNWKMVIFELGKNGSYKSVVLSQSPHDCTSRGKQDCGPAQKYGLRFDDKCSNGKPCLQSYLYESAVVEHQFRSGTYYEVSVGD